MIQRVIVLPLALAFAGVGCAKDESKPAEPSASPSAESPKHETGEPRTVASEAPSEAAVAAAVGIEAGGIAHQPQDAAGTVARLEGTVEVRRLGEETWTPVAQGETLYEGDVIRTSMQASAQVVLADKSIVELPEVAAIAIGDRSTGKAQASSAAVLSGAARFSVSARAKGEGPFVVYLPAAMVQTSADAVFAVGVVADGRARIGAEKGDLQVLGMAKLDAAPFVLKPGMVTLVAVSGDVGAAAKYDPASWGAWRDEMDAEIDATAAVNAHGVAIGGIRGELDGNWRALEAQASAPPVEATFTVASRAQLQTWALVSHAYLATEIRLRHPEVEVAFAPIQANVAAALLYPKKLHVVAYGWLRPAQVTVNAQAHAAVTPTAVAWYVRPANLKSKLIVGVPATVVVKPVFAVRPAIPMAQVRLSGAAAFHVGGSVGADVRGAAVEAHGASVEAHGAAVKAKGMAEGVEAGMKGQVKGAVKVGAGAAADVKRAATVEIKAPAPPKAEVKGKAEIKAKGGFSIGGGN